MGKQRRSNPKQSPDSRLPTKIRLMMKPGEIDSGDNMLAIHGLKVDLYSTPDELYFLWSVDGVIPYRSYDFNKVLDQYNSINGSNLPYSVKGVWNKVIKNTQSRAIEAAQARALRSWMKDNPERVQEVKEKYGI